MKKFGEEYSEADMTKNLLRVVWAMDFGRRTNDIPLHIVVKSLLSSFSVIEDKRNLFSLVPMFTDFTGYVISDKYRM